MSVGFAEFLQDFEPKLSLFGAKCTEEKHIDFLADRRCQKTWAIQVRTNDVQIGITFESVSQQLRMKRRIVGNEYTNWTSLFVRIVHSYSLRDSLTIWPRVRQCAERFVDFATL